MVIPGSSPELSVEPSPELTAGHRLQPAGPADAAPVLALVSACDIAVLGYPDVSLEDIEHDLTPAEEGGGRLNMVLRRDQDDAVTSWWHATAHPGSPQCFGDVYVDPSLDPLLADAVAAAGWAEIERFARAFLDGALLKTGSLHGDAATERRLSAAGFRRVRTFWRMSADVGAAPLAPAPTGGATADPASVVPDLVIRPATDLRLLHALREETFAEHWGHVAESYEAWSARKPTEPGYDPSLWFVAEVAGEPAGFMICSRQMANDDALYVATLGTRSPYRGRGVASSLLRHAADVARREGFAMVRLGVDSDNPTGAPGVYRAAGFEVLFAMHAWHKPLDPA